MLTLNTILHPTDFSTPSNYAFRLALLLARDHGSRLIVLHVVGTLGPELVTYGEAATELEPESYQRKLWTELRQIQPKDPSVDVAHRLAEGDEAAEIIRAAKETNSGLIVMATHGRTGVQRLLMGSVAEKVMRHAPCPVLTVKSPLAGVNLTSLLAQPQMEVPHLAPSAGPD